MKRKLLAAVLVLATAGMIAATAATASAHPSKTTRCSSCHSGPNVAVSATLASTTGTTATYNVSAPSANAIAVFDGSTKLATITGTSGQFTVAFGKTYTVYAVQGPTTSDGLGSTTVSPVAPIATDATAPTTTSNAVATYLNSASITLSAVDNIGGTGVAHTYYILDGAAQVEGTVITTSALGSHTLEFWSVDASLNIETHHNLGFTVTAPPAPTPDTTAPTTTSNAVATYAGSASITLTAVDNAGGSGVAHTYYILDGATQVEGTTISTAVVGSHTLSFWSVDASGNAEAANPATFEVTAPLPDAIAPVTTSNAMMSYMGTATITLTAVDNAGGSGVANTYYILDGAAQVEGTTITTSVLGSHTLEYWSVDVAGNVEVTNATSFSIVAVPVGKPKCTIGATTRMIHRRHHVRFSGSVTPAAAGDHAVVYVKKPGSTRWIRVKTLTIHTVSAAGSAKWTLSYTPTKRGTYRFQVRFKGSVSKTFNLTVR